MEADVDFVTRSTEENIATISLNRGKVNAVNETMIEEQRTCFQQSASDPEVNAVILMGQGKFFSFGFDIPEFFNYWTRVSHLLLGWAGKFLRPFKLIFDRALFWCSL